MAEERNVEIINELRKNFLSDKKFIQDKIVETEVYIKECNDYIESLNKKDDCDFNIFSPRSASRVYKDQISEKKLAIEQYEFQLRDLYKQLGSVSKKLDSLDELDTAVTPSDISKKDEVSFIKFQEDDRKRIAADLHDGVLQNLTLVMHNLELTSKFIDYDAIRAKLELETNRKLVKETIEEIRNTIFNLRPMQFEDFGFKKSVENLISEINSRTSMSIEANIDNLDDDIDKLYLLTVFRVVQELVLNSIKHSEGSLVDVFVSRRPGDIYISVSDDGKGFNPEAVNSDNHFGLKILNERVSILNGTVDFKSGVNGTSVSVIIPIK